MTHPPDDPVAAEVEAILRRLPLAQAGPRLDDLVHAALDEATLRRKLVQREGASALAGPGEAGERPFSWLRQLRPALLASAALLALAFGVRPLLPSHTGQTSEQAVTGTSSKLPSPQQPLAVIEPPLTIPDEMVSFPAIAPLPDEAAARTDSPHAAQSPPASQPIGFQQTFERVDNDGVVLVEGQAAYQRVRRQAVRRIVVLDPQTGQHVTVSIPTQELLVRRVEPF